MAFDFRPPHQPVAAQEPALGLVELDSVARGFVVADAIVKRAYVRLCRAHAISPGHFVVLFTGMEAEVEESLSAGVVQAGGSALGHLLLTQVHPAVPRAIDGAADAWPALTADPSVAIVETFTVASALLAADAACKTAPVALTSMRLGQGLGGKAYFTLTGELHDLEAATERAMEVAGAPLIKQLELIARPHPDFLAYLAS